MDVIKTTSKIVIQRRTIKTDWSDTDDKPVSYEAARARIDFLRSQQGTALYRITEISTTVYGY